MSNLTEVFARKEPTREGPAGARDVQVYRDRECTRPFGRYPWYMRRPAHNAKTVTLNCYHWRLVWLPALEVNP